MIVISLHRITTFFSMLFFACSVSFSQQQFWQQTNGPFAGNVNAIAVDSEGRIFMSSRGPNGGLTGLYSSTKYSNSWSQTSFPASVTCLAINTSDHIFVGTDGSRIFRSTDHGQTWVYLQGGLIHAIIYAIIRTPDGFMYAATGGGVYRSIDNGDTWVLTALNYAVIQSLAADSVGNIFASTTQDSRQGSFYGPIYRSSDSGNSWQLVYSGFHSISGISVDTSGIVYAATSLGVLKSTTQGAQWNGTPLSSPTKIVETGVHGKVFAVTTTGVYYSTNQGDTWIQTNTASSNIISLATRGLNELFVGYDSDKGVQYSSDLGNTWKQIGVPNTYIWALTVSPTGQIFAGAGYGSSPIPGGIYRLDQEKWTQVNSGLVSPYVTSLITNNKGTLFAGGRDGVYRSTNNGNNWVLTSLKKGYVYSLVVNSLNDVFCSVGGNVYRSQDDGVSWSLVDSLSSTIIFLAVDDSSNIYSSAFGQSVKRSTDSGSTWTQLGIVGAASIEPILVTPQRTIFLGTSREGIYRSTNLGETWTHVGLDSLWVWCLARNSLGHIFAGTINAGVYRSTDNGDTWESINNGLLPLEVRALAVDSYGFLYAGLLGGSVSRSIFSTTDLHRRNPGIPEEYYLSQNFPNPFNSTTKIRYFIPVESYVSLKVYTMLGQEISTLIDQKVSEGEFEIDWNTQGLSSGVYFYRLQAGAFSETKKLLLLK